MCPRSDVSSTCPNIMLCPVFHTMPCNDASAVTLPAFCPRARSGAAITQVCRRFRAIYWSEPAVWRTLYIYAKELDSLPKRRQAAWLAGKRALLQRVAPVVSKLVMADHAGALAMAARSTRLRAAADGAGNGSGACRLAELLRLLQPGVAREVELTVYPSLPAAALEALPRWAATSPRSTWSRSACVAGSPPRCGPCPRCALCT